MPVVVHPVRRRGVGVVTVRCVLIGRGGLRNGSAVGFTVIRVMRADEAEGVGCEGREEDGRDERVCPTSPTPPHVPNHAIISLRARG